MKEILHKAFAKKAIFWDFDGCLCDSERVHYTAYAKAFSEYGHELNEYDYYETFTHTGAGVSSVINTYKLQCDADHIRNTKAKIYWELISEQQAKIFDEIPEILSILNKRGLKNIIASNSPASEINLILSQQKQPLKIDRVLGVEPGMRKKPFPDIYNKALSELNISPFEASVMEDSERGLIAAQRASIEAIWVKTSFNTRFNTEVPHVLNVTHKQILELLRSEV